MRSILIGSIFWRGVDNKPQDEPLFLEPVFMGSEFRSCAPAPE